MFWSCIKEHNMICIPILDNWNVTTFKLSKWQYVTSIHLPTCIFVNSQCPPRVVVTWHVKLSTGISGLCENYSFYGGNTSTVNDLELNMIGISYSVKGFLYHLWYKVVLQAYCSGTSSRTIFTKCDKCQHFVFKVANLLFFYT